MEFNFFQLQSFSRLAKRSFAFEEKPTSLLERVHGLQLLVARANAGEEIPRLVCMHADRRNGQARPASIAFFPRLATGKTVT